MLFVQYQIWLKPPNPTRVDLATIVVVPWQPLRSPGVQPFFWGAKIGKFLGQLFLGKIFLEFGKKTIIAKKNFRNKSPYFFYTWFKQVARKGCLNYFPLKNFLIIFFG
jgi:hypothetical protein